MEIATIYQEFNQALSSYIRTKVRTNEDAEDILQTVFLKISLNLESLSGKDKLKEWIFTVTRNTIYDYYRLNARQRTSPLEEHSPEPTLLDNDSRPGMELEHCLENFIEQLPENYRQIIKDAEIKGRKQKDLAVEHGIPYSSLKSKVQRGREQLKKMLLQCCKIELDSRGRIMDVNPIKSGNKNTCNSCHP